MRSKITTLAFFLFFFCNACNDGGRYSTTNPPFDGVVIGGDGTSVGGFVKIPASANSPCSSQGDECFVTISNRSFGTLKTPLPASMLLDSSKKWGLSITFGGKTIIYVYTNKGRHLERDNATYTNGVFPSGSDYNLVGLWNETTEDILVRGILPISKSATHPDNALLLYFSLKEKQEAGDTLSVCSGSVNKASTGVGDFLETPDCFINSF